MNEVFIIGKIVSKIEYKFIVNSKRNTAITIFNIKTKENVKHYSQNIVVKCYNELADFALQKLKNIDMVFINGTINSNMEVEGKYIMKLIWKD